MNTDRLIDSLVADLDPVRPLRPAWQRTVIWLAIAVPAIAVLVAAMGLRPDLAGKLADLAFVSQEAAMIATAVIAAWAALSAGIPGTSRSVLIVPALPLLGWAATMAYQIRRDGTEIAFAVDVDCIPGIAVTGLVPMLAMIVLLRGSTVFNRGLAVFWGAMAAAGLANAGLRLFHTVDAALLVIVWQFGTVVGFSVVATFARELLVPVRGPTTAAP